MAHKKQIHFILNDTEVQTSQPAGIVLLDFLRYDQRLTGTKEGCREGDCGACTVLLGEMENGNIHYRAVTSCLLPLGDVMGKHVVTIEGLNTNGLTPVQQAILEQGAVQCGFCTPGIVVSLTGFLFSQHIDEDNAIASLDGNICRCTGYQSIKRAGKLLCEKLHSAFPKLSDDSAARIRSLVDAQFLPAYFLAIPERLEELQQRVDVIPQYQAPAAKIVAGGTDLFVQKPDELMDEELQFLSFQNQCKGVWREGKGCFIGAATNVEEMKESPIMQELFPKLREYFGLISSTPIRHRATIGGNIVNASPIGDLIIFFLALDTTVHLSNGETRRTIALKDFFTGYKELNKTENEIIESISFPTPQDTHLFNFEKVSKRKYLDIASVNTAIGMNMDGQRIQKIYFSTGGVAPIPLYLTQTVNFLQGRMLSEGAIHEATSIAMSEISPISDVRGSASYKRLLLRQLILAHFVELFPEYREMEVLP